MNVTDTKGLVTQALIAMRGNPAECEYFDGCDKQGWMISQDWADQSGMGRVHLCDEHRDLFHETFLA